MTKIVAPRFADGFEYDDLALVPRLSAIKPSEVSLVGKVTRKISSELPMLASPMDSVISLQLARELCRMGSIPLIPCTERTWRSGKEILTTLTNTIMNCRVGALVDTDPKVFMHIEEAVLKRVDLVLLDSLHSAPHLHIDAVKRLKDYRPELQVISGNIVHGDDAGRLVELGVDAIRVGFTGASINDGYAITGCGRAQAAAVADCALAVKGSGVPVIADGGIASVRHMVLAFALGASAVMMGSMFAQLVESGAPFVDRNQKTKHYRGMSRPELLDEELLAEGTEKIVAVSGTLPEMVEIWTKQLCVAFARAGADSIDMLHMNATLERHCRGGFSKDNK